MRSSGKLHLVSVGPGSAELIPPLAETALRASEVIVGYELYLTWIKPWIDGKAIHSPALTQERERASLAIEHARNRRVVSLVSSGDIGVYGMAALVLEEMAEEDRFELALFPGFPPRQVVPLCLARRCHTILPRYLSLICFVRGTG